MNHSTSRSQISPGSKISFKKGTQEITDDLNLKGKKMKEFIEHQDVLEERISTLKNRKDNWDDEGSKAPTSLTMNNANCTITTLLHSVIDSDSSWLNPFISSDFDGEITAVWHKGKRELHLQIGEEEVEYFKVWGININTEMEVGFLTNEDHLSIWQWLIAGE